MLMLPLNNVILLRGTNTKSLKKGALFSIKIFEKKSRVVISPYSFDGFVKLNLE